MPDFYGAQALCPLKVPEIGMDLRIYEKHTTQSYISALFITNTPSSYNWIVNKI